MTTPILTVQSLSQLTAAQDWQLSLAHDRAEHLLIWIQRGQGRLLIDGQRSGTGSHNAVFVPARHLFALDLGRQAGGTVLVLPDGTDLRLPQTPRQLRIREIHAQAELTGLFEAAQREQASGRPLGSEAMEAHGALITVWLRRQMALDEHVPQRKSAGQRLAARFCERVTRHYSQNLTMADYAAALDVTPTHLTRACKAATGKTAADLLTERVLYEARMLLANTRVPAQDIARHLGFGSAAYFTRFMQHHTRHSPSELRQPPPRQRLQA
ncbi:AraC family transcriptional regulator [Sulfitobacter sp. D35]|uniref:helix-turn-helix transcriptional regulator n=1 Tax=Sulfitobacter sp. D35 TaxID=3083252 RepID=UPI00296FA02E|nr:AraC family transcriptional regulator [Sulfitobacter sp. D35]MDW4497727.1 AraC family transcriptional regulator [Sulfitobacter sp. D35]